MSEATLKAEIIALSFSQEWAEAKLEWSLSAIYEAATPQTCLCGHFPIIEICVLNNKRTCVDAEVGNCCVKKFIGLPSDKIFSAVKRVRKDPTKSLNAEAIFHAFDRSWLNAWEKDFYLNIMGKRVLTEKQQLKKRQVNNLILANMRK